MSDAIYRRGPGGEALYPDAASIFGRMHPADDSRVEELAASLRQAIPQDAAMYVPLALGGHVDHRLTRLAAERLGRPLWYYRDLPYDIRDGQPPEDLPIPPHGETRVPASTLNEIVSRHTGQPPLPLHAPPT